LENVNDDDDDDDMDIIMAWKSITTDLDYYELKQHKPCFDEECSESLE